MDKRNPEKNRWAEKAVIAGLSKEDVTSISDAEIFNPHDWITLPSRRKGDCEDEVCWSGYFPEGGFYPVGIGGVKIYYPGLWGIGQYCKTKLSEAEFWRVEFVDVEGTRCAIATRTSEIKSDKSSEL